MKHHAVYVELDVNQPTTEQIEGVREYLDQLGYSPAVGTSPAGRLDVQLSVPADDVYMATARGVVAAQQLAGAKAVTIESRDGDEYDAMQGFAQIPDLVSVAQAAEILQVSRQRVQQMIDAGQFVTARKVGNSTVLATNEVTGRVHNSTDTSPV
ncbi:helix-turn-helix domain-containing protein [Curtobacterium sp. Curtsp57]|uniref:helix-turn-helix domain-containing protein n=1 Tax=Curtobacterium sp. Curtsp57 TaxID=3243047 RepID=UPI0039B4DCF6